MTASTRSDVLVVGAGLAGLSAAVALSSAGAGVTLLERKPYIGGRAYSYLHPALDEVIDSQHVLLGCCTNLIDLCSRSGADQHIRWYDEIRFLEPSAGSKPARESILRPGSAPSPGHSSASFLAAPMLSLNDKLRIALGLTHFLRGYPADDTEAFSTWLKRTGQTERAIRNFWEPVIVGALNDSFERCSTRYAGQVFYESFLKSAEGGRLGIPTQPMSAFYASTAALAEQQGTALRLRTSADTITQLPGGDWQVTDSAGECFLTSNLLLALPFEQTQRLLQTLPASPDVLRITASLPHFTHAPITTLHLWFDRDVVPVDHAALLNTRIQWVFNKTRIRRDELPAPNPNEQYLELVISASFPELKQSRDQIMASALEELARFFPAVRVAKLLRSGILKEARATFSVTPGLDRFRPLAATGVAGLFLAGDWTCTGWPSTMEGAVRSGRLAAEAISRSAGNPQSFLTADLPATGLMKWLAKGA